MHSRFRTVFALFAGFAALGASVVPLAGPASAAVESPPCDTACTFHLGSPQSSAHGASEVGLQFTTDIPGWIAAVCFWPAGAESGPHTATLWDSAGTQLAQTSVLTTPGVEACADFPIPVAIDANTVYTASYTAEADYYLEPHQYSLPIEIGHLHAPARAGVLGTSGSMPTTAGIDGDGYGVDVAFLSSLRGLPADCPSTLTAPTTPTAAPGNASATVSWGPATSDPEGCIAGYIVTPFLDGVIQPPTLIPGTGTTTVIKGLTNGLTYTFTIAAESGRAIGPASAETAAVTVGTPTAASALKVKRVAKGAVKVSFKAPKKANGAAIKSYAATCRSGAGAARSTSGHAGPLTVRHLTPGKKYTCTVRATNRRGTGPASKRSAPVRA